MFSVVIHFLQASPETFNNVVVSYRREDYMVLHLSSGHEVTIPWAGVKFVHEYKIPNE